MNNKNTYYEKNVKIISINCYFPKSGKTKSKNIKITKNG